MYKKKTRQGGFDQTHKAKISIGENSCISRLTGSFSFINNMIKGSHVSCMMSISRRCSKVSGTVVLCTVCSDDLNKHSLQPKFLLIWLMKTT